jgi:hypothetical protein
MAETVDEVRDMLESKAREFHMPVVLPEGVMRKARRRMSFRALVAGVAVITMATAVPSLAGGGKAPSPNWTSPTRRTRTVAGPFRWPREHSTWIRSGGGRRSPGHVPSARSPRILGDLVLGGRTGSEVDAFTNCMRREGFPMPDPVWNGDEAVFKLEGTGIDVASNAGREAVFVTCAPGVLTP